MSLSNALFTSRQVFAINTCEAILDRQIKVSILFIRQFKLQLQTFYLSSCHAINYSNDYYVEVLSGHEIDDSLMLCCSKITQII